MRFDWFNKYRNAFEELATIIGNIYWCLELRKEGFMEIYDSYPTMSFPGLYNCTF